MPDNLLSSLTLVVLLGMAAQWLAWRLRLPSILLLLVFGFFSGPEWLGLVDPDALLGDLLLPLVSISAALILFEGGLSLSFREVRTAAGVVSRLVTLGLLITWGLATLAARYLLDLPLGLSVLIAAIVTVSGPTVVLPLLHHIRPRGAVGPILKWEGIVIDPIGAVLAVLVFEALLVGNVREAAPHALLGVLLTLGVGGAAGLVGAGLLLFLLKRYWIPDYLHNPAALATVVAAFAASNAVQEESGLLAVTILGVIMANRASVSVRHIVEFKENLRVLLLSGIFILLAARLDLESFAQFDVGAVYFLAALILVVRPVGVFACTWRSSLTMTERVLLAWMFPRGIVAAAVASVFALRLEEAAIPGSEILVPLTFLVIVGTVVIYGFTTEPLARVLQLANPNPQGVLMVGAHSWARQLAAALHEAEIPVVLVDTNRHNLASARMLGLRTWYGSALAEHAIEEMELTDLGRLFAVTPNDEVNTLTALHYLHIFGREKIYQLAPEAKASARSASAPADFRGRTLFAPDADYWSIGARFSRGATVKATGLTEKFTFDDFLALHGDDALLVGAKEGGTLTVSTVDKPLKPAAGQTLIAIVKEEEA